MNDWSNVNDWSKMNEWGEAKEKIHCVVQVWTDQLVWSIIYRKLLKMILFIRQASDISWWKVTNAYLFRLLALQIKKSVFAFRMLLLNNLNQMTVGHSLIIEWSVLFQGVDTITLNSTSNKVYAKWKVAIATNRTQWYQTADSMHFMGFQESDFNMSRCIGIYEWSQ